MTDYYEQARRGDAPLSMKISPEDRRTLYDQERQNHRYQDGLRWSRIQTVALIEGGMLWGIFWQPVSDSMGLIIALSGSLMSFVICLMALKDSSDARWHLDRVRQLERMMGVSVRDGVEEDICHRLMNVRTLLWEGMRCKKDMGQYREEVPSGTSLLEWAVRFVIVGNIILVLFCSWRSLSKLWAIVAFMGFS